MAVRRVLIFAPLVVALFLLQSYLWVPTYEEQTRGSPERLEEFISGSIGDASILNPILSADSASSQIEGLVFEGLLDRDEELRFRGRVAESWEIFEEAFFCVNEAADVPGAGKAGPKEVVALMEAVRRGERASTPEVKAALDLVRDMRILPAERVTVAREIRAAAGGEPRRIQVTVERPPRIRVTLAKVEPSFFETLEQLLGRGYFASFDGPGRVRSEPEVSGDLLSALAAELLPAVEHNPVLVFRLRPGIRFHDGHPVGASDVKFTYEAIMDPRNLSPRVSDYEPVKSVEVLDPLTVRITYKRLHSPAVGTWGMGILPKHLLDRQAMEQEAAKAGKDPKAFSIRQSRFNRSPVGCGPFVFREWKSDQYIALDRFDDYWEGRPNYSRYVFRVIPDLLTQEMEFYAGTVDSYGVQPHQVKRLKDDPRFQSFSGVAFGYTYIGYNTRRPPFDDPRVRTALGMAVDVDKIIDYVLYGQGERITGPFVKQTDYYNRAIRPLSYDPQGALRLLEQAGWQKDAQGWLAKDGKRLQFTLITNSGNDLRKAVLAIAQDAWKRIGIDVRTDLLEWSVFIQERVNKLDFDALILGWQMGIDPDLYQIWHSSQTQPHQLNFVGFKNREADDLIIGIRQEYDHDRQVSYCHRLHEIIAREQPYTFLYVSRWTAVLDKRIVIKTVDAGGTGHYRKIRPTKTGNYTFDFNKWIKLPEVPSFAADG